MDDRQLTIDEQFLRITTTESNHDFFKSVNTSPLGEVQHDGDDWVFVHVIRYGGSAGGPNRWRLV